MSAPRPERPDQGHRRRRLRWALHAYPREVRKAEGEMLLSLACDILDGGGSSINREALGLLRGGLAVRLGAAARAPWDEALRRAALAIAAALLAIVCGAAVAWLREPAWPGWSWIAVLTAPALVVAGHLAGRRVAIACGALLLFILGVAQGNSQLATVPLEGSIEWGIGGSGSEVLSGHGFALPLLSCALPATVLLLASAAHHRRPVPRSVALATVASVIAGAAAVHFVLQSGTTARNLPYGAAEGVTIGDVRMDGLGLCMVAAAVAAVAALAVGFTRRRGDPSAMLAGTLAVAAIMPVAGLYVFAALPLGNAQLLLALPSSAIAMVLMTLRLVRLSSTAAS